MATRYSNRRASADITGMTELNNRFDRLVRTATRSILDKGIRAASRPIITSARANLRRSEQSGTLRKSIGIKTGSSRQAGARYGVIGPRVGSAFVGQFDGGARVPVRYAHLVEFGTRHSKAKPFLRPAYDSNKRTSPAIFARTIQPLIQSEVKKIGRKAMKSV